MFSISLDNQNKNNDYGIFSFERWEELSSYSGFTLNNINFFGRILECKNVGNSSIEFSRINGLIVIPTYLPINGTNFRFIFNKKFSDLKGKKGIFSLVLGDNNSRTVNLNIKIFGLKGNNSVQIWELGQGSRVISPTGSGIRRITTNVDFTENFDYLYIEFLKNQNDYLYLGNGQVGQNLNYTGNLEGINNILTIL